MTISQAQLTVLTLLITGVIGFKRGWAREVITTAIVLGTLLFLELGGGTLLTTLFSGAASGAGGGASTASCYNMTGSLSDLVFGGMTAIGYYAGNRHGTNPVSGNHRVTGIIPGVITGGAISFWVGQHLFSHAQGILNILGAFGFLASLPVLLILGVIGLVSALFVSRNGQKAAKAH